MASTVALAWLLIMSGPAAREIESQGPITSMFAYDQTAPLDIRESGVEKVPGGSVHDISYASPKGGRVTAYLVIPEGKGPFAAIEFVHWGQGNRTEFLSEALSYARRGAISLLIDGPFNRPNYHPGPSFMDDPQREHDMYVQLVIDARRGFDLLLSRPDADPRRVAYVGHSLGATWGGALAGVETRVRSFGLMGGLPSLTDFSGTDTFSKQVRDKYSAEQIRKYSEILGPINPENFISNASPSNIFFQFARWDRYITQSSAERYEKVASQPKRVTQP